MRQLVPDYIKNLKVYQAGKPIEELAKEKGLTQISKLASNENPLGPSPFAIKEMTNSLWDVNRYPDMHALELKNSLGELYNLKNENIILGNGSEGIMAYIARAFLRPGDQVITSEKTFIGFYILTRGIGAKITMTPMTEDYKYNVKKMAEAITDDTKLIYIANPNNPTGTYLTKDEFDYLMEFVPAHVLVVLDEAYFEYAKDEKDYPDSMNYRYDNVITLRTFSKAYGLSGIRVGYGFARVELIENLSKIKLPFEPNLIGQKGAVGALKDLSHLEQTLQNNKKEIEKCFSYLANKNFSPIKSITNFISFKTGSERASQYLFEQLLNQGVIIRPLKANEMPDYVRVSIGIKSEMDHFYQAMDKVLIDYDQQFGRA